MIVLLFAGCAFQPTTSPENKRPYTATEAVEAARIALGLADIDVISLQATLDSQGRSLRWSVWLANATSGFEGVVYAPGGYAYYPPFETDEFPRGAVWVNPIPRLDVPTVPGGYLDSPDALGIVAGGKAQLAVMAGRPTWLVGQSKAFKAIDAMSGAPLELPEEYSFGNVHAIAEPMALGWAADARLERAFATEEYEPIVDHRIRVDPDIQRRESPGCLGEAPPQVHFRLDRVPSDGRAPVWLVEYYSPARNHGGLAVRRRHRLLVEGRTPSRQSLPERGGARERDVGRLGQVTFKTDG